MKKLLKRALTILAIGCALVVVAGALGLYLFWQRPPVRFLLSQAGFRQPDQCTRKEIFVFVQGEKTSVMVYRHRSMKSDRYYFFQHGHAVQGNRHPTLDRLARSLCDATGMNVLIPQIDISGGGKTLEPYFQRISAVYQVLVQRFPGRYRGFGSCIGANLLLVALKRVPREIYPEKMFLISPFFSGKSLLRGYNKMMGSDKEFDIIFKLAVTLDSDVYDEQEKALIQKAIAAAKPGQTDRDQMRQILGEKLFRDIVVIQARHPGLEQIDSQMMFSRAADRPACSYFIIHSMQDNIVPYYEGKNLAKYMREIGLSTNFLGTELVAHTENRVTVTGFMREAAQLVGFFDRLFEGDV